MNDETNQLFPAEETPQVQPKRRGRPRKNPLPEENAVKVPAPAETAAAETVAEKVPAKRGRKPKK